MCIPDVADLIVIAARALDIDTGEALDLIDLPAAEVALAQARQLRGQRVEQTAAALLTALIRHRPLPRDNPQIALLAVLQFLGQQDLDLDLRPAAAARDLIANITTGTLAEPAVAGWIADRLRAQPATEDGIMKRLTGRKRCDPLPAMARTAKFPHFTDQAYQAVMLAEAEARGLRHN